MLLSTLCILVITRNTVTGVVLGPCFSKILARTTFVLVSLLEAKNPGQDAIFGTFCLWKQWNDDNTVFFIYKLRFLVKANQIRYQGIVGYPFLQALLDFITSVQDIPHRFTHFFAANHFCALLYWAFSHRFTHNHAAFCRARSLHAFVKIFTGSLFFLAGSLFPFLVWAKIWVPPLIQYYTMN